MLRRLVYSHICPGASMKALYWSSGITPCFLLVENEENYMLFSLSNAVQQAGRSGRERTRRRSSEKEM